MDHKRLALHVHELDPGDLELDVSVALGVHLQFGEVALVPAAARPLVRLGALRIVVTARRLARRGCAVLVGRRATSVLVEVKPVLAGRQPLELGREL